MTQHNPTLFFLFDENCGCTCNGGITNATGPGSLTRLRQDHGDNAARDVFTADSLHRLSFSLIAMAAALFGGSGDAYANCASIVRGTIECTGVISGTESPGARMAESR